METLFLITTACVCLIVGLYFFFVRVRPSEKSHEPQ
jgi:hypothetical protein